MKSLRERFLIRKAPLSRRTMGRWFIASLTLFMIPLSLMADNKKEQQEQMRTIIQLLQMEEDAQAGIPDFVADDQKARDYCQDVLNRSDEAYAQDTAQLNKMLRDAQWVLGHFILPDEKMEKKLIKQNYHPAKLDGIFAWADYFLREVPMRHAVLTTFCDKQLQRRQEARQRTMPEGLLVSLSYREYGSSRPTTLEYALARDADTGGWMLNDQEVDDKVAEEVRALVEQHRTFQCLDRYEEAPSFPQAPQVTGGLPSWEFICKFEKGTIVTGSECMPVPESCSVIVSYLTKIINEICKNPQNQD